MQTLPIATSLRITCALGVSLLPTLVQAQSQVDIKVAWGQPNVKRADAALELAYKSVKNYIYETKTLTAAQLEWIKFRDAEALFVASSGATRDAWIVLYANAITTLTEQRTKHLLDNVYLPEPGSKINSPDIALNNAYKRLIATLPESRRKLLVASELAWIKFRDTEAARFKSMEPRYVKWAVDALTVERWQSLQP